MATATSLFVHSSGLGPGMWRAYAAALAPDFQVLAPALVGYAPNPTPVDADAARRDEELVSDLIDAQPGRVHLVGHSYGGFLAANVALARPQKIASLALLEPVMFGALRQSGDQAASVDLRYFEETDAFSARDTAGTEPWLEAFIDYWNGAGAWRSFSESQRAPFRAAGPKVAREVEAVSQDGAPFEHYRFTAPLLLIRGARSPVGARRIVDHLQEVNLEARVVEIPNAGHVFPVTHWRDVVPILRDHWRSSERGN